MRCFVYDASYVIRRAVYISRRLCTYPIPCIHITSTVYISHPLCIVHIVLCIYHIHHMFCVIHVVFVGWFLAGSVSGDRFPTERPFGPPFAVSEPRACNQCMSQRSIDHRLCINRIIVSVHPTAYCMVSLGNVNSYSRVTRINHTLITGRLPR